MYTVYTYTHIHKYTLIYISVSVCYRCLMSISKWSSTHREVSMDLSQAFSCRLGDDEKRAWAREARTIAQPLLCVAFGLLSKSKLSGFGLCCWKSKQTKQKVMIKHIPEQPHKGKRGKCRSKVSNLILHQAQRCAEYLTSSQQLSFF